MGSFEIVLLHEVIRIFIHIPKVFLQSDLTDLILEVLLENSSTTAQLCDRSPPHSRDRQDRSYSSRERSPPRGRSPPHDRSPPRESYGRSSRTRSPPPSRWDSQQPPSPQVFGRVQTLREGDYSSVKRTYDAPYTVCVL